MNEAALVRDVPASQADASLAEITAKRRGLLRRYLYQHPRVMDGVVVFSYALLVAPTVVDAIMSGAWLAAALLFVVAGALFFRRSHPVALAAFVAVMEVAVTLLHPWGSNVSAGLWFSLYAVAVVHTRRFALVAMAAATAPLALLYLLAAVGPMENSFVHDAGGNPGDFHLLTSIATGATIALSNVIATGIGISVRQRREHEQEIAAWAARTASLASVNERNRIAREMHDVVAHSLTVMVSLSDGAAVVVRKSPDRASEVLGELSRTGRTALADMRRVLGVLRDDAGGTAPRQPLASGDSLAKLLEGFRTAGLPLHYSHTGPALPDDAAFQLTVYRIVQESLTNVLRYGRSLGRVDVGIIRAGSSVTIEVLDDGAGVPGAGTSDGGGPGPVLPGSGVGPGSGQGLAGMAERARIYAGTVVAGRRGRGWRVCAVLTWPADEPAETPQPSTPTARHT
ncbi:sensor histidine kinase [Pseudarthrobacter sp. NIBRBAC000502772]|uniref:sensor histidine kinase n=1 Tax=Pseudarthrobacter sp. NIBRBAC000502772 TaxID=2590775 RepID=UPI00112FF833|nr:histidine kinase [Pseudarthrobacter sp. NIBRBAC000502772]QDG65146.1 sensor histidine kinase [Pseudarthrobacter sp. NIBRBAC000502772]